MHFSAGIIVGSLISAAAIWLLRFRSRRPAIPALPPLLPHLRGWVDYDRSQLPVLNPMERVDYLEKRVRLVVVRPMRRILDTEIEPTTDSSALLIFGVSLCCAIEALGKFLNGGTGGNANRFRTFLSRYLHTDFQTKSLGPTHTVVFSGNIIITGSHTGSLSAMVASRAPKGNPISSSNLVH